MNLLLELDKARADGDPWCNLGPALGWGEGTVDFALKHQLIEANTVDGEATEYRITPTGQKALCGELPEEVVTGEPLGVPVNDRLDYVTSELLRLLANHNGWMPTPQLPKSISYTTRALAQGRGYVEARGNTAKREFRITERGLRALGWDEAAIAHRLLGYSEKPSQVNEAEEQRRIDEAKARVLAKKAAAAAPQPPVEISGPEINMAFQIQVEGDTTPEDVTHAIVQQMNDFADRVHPVPMPSMMNVIVDSLPDDHSCTDDCQHCVYRDVVELLEDRVPGVRDVVNGLRLIDRRR